MNSIKHLIRTDLLEFKPYSSARDESTKGNIWLNANESPYPSEFSAFTSVNRYPEKQPRHLKTRLAQIYNLNENQIALLRGSDDCIDLLTRLFCNAGRDAVMICPPTYGMYSVSALLQGAEVVNIPLDREDGYQLNLQAINRNWQEKVKLIFLCTPNNPTGNSLRLSDIEYLCEQYKNKAMIVVDEAYIDFSDKPSVISYIDKYINLIVLRTFSKAYGLAAARFGVLLAQVEVIDWVLKIAPPYPLSAATISMVSHATNSEQLNLVQKHINQIKKERESLLIALRGFSWVKTVWPTDANFILIKVENAIHVMSYCNKHHIVLRSMHEKEGLENCIRITVGLPEENRQLIEVLQRLESL